ncbi:MAG: 1-acyl-sn-glycerol-3-phosphate acyltransferase [Cellvibrionaceae bacterium]|nr:1-acyl-sn-glycerol-3-phosphate acyltransferase [Cellvibrionaceae bacterium]
MMAATQVCNKGWRILATGVCFILFGLGAAVIGSSFLLVAPLPCSAKRKQRWVRRAITCACRFYIETMKRMGLLSYALVRQRPLTHTGVLIVANHPSLLDAIFLLAAYDNLCCIAKKTLWHNPFTAMAVRLAGYIPNSGEQFIERATAKLAEGENILIFPEGTRNQYDTQLAFKRGAANIAVSAHCQILPVLIRCTPRTLQKQERWYQVPAFAPHFSVREQALIVLDQVIDTGRAQTIQYRHLTQYLRHYYLAHLS